MARDISYEVLGRSFSALYGTLPRFFRAPGRVNLIGEHTDYNEGFVFPLALDRATVTAAAARADRRVRVHSQGFPETVEFDLDQPFAQRIGYWASYVEGVARVLETHGARLRGADLLISSDVPVGAGLSSSAALEVSAGLAFTRLAEVSLDPTDLALMCQQAEHEYAGTKCGIMDQMIAVRGRAGHALLLDCRSLAGQLFPLGAQVSVVVCDSRVRHELAASEYNTRRAECAEAVALLQPRLPNITALRDVSVEDFKTHQDVLPDPVLRRCRHIVTENARTVETAQALTAGDFAQVGALLNASHASLRDDYEVSCVELDTLAAAAQALPYVYGARMTGGGFGGCTVNLVTPNAVADFRAALTRAYQERHGREPHFYIITPGDGAQEVV